MKMQEIVIKNRDGLRMGSMVRTPQGDARGTIVLLHGQGGLRDQKLLTKTAEALTESGYVTFAFDTSHAVRSLDARFFDSTPTKDIRDTEDAVAYVRNESWFVAPLILVGHSMGGFSAVHYAGSHPANVDKLVLLAPAMSWRTLAGAAVPFLLLWYLAGYKKVITIDDQHEKLGRAWVTDFMKYDAYRDAPHVTAPTLIISAGNDDTVAKPFEHRRFAKKFKNAKQVTIRGADHDFGEQEAEVIATIRQWLTSS